MFVVSDYVWYSSSELLFKCLYSHKNNIMGVVELGVRISEVGAKPDEEMSEPSCVYSVLLFSHE